MIEILTLDAKINDNAPEKYRGLDRFDARKQVVADLEALGLLESVKPHKLMVPRGDRTGVVIEPMLTDQWFVAMSKPAPEGTFHPGKSIAETALDVVRNGEIKFVPENWSTTYYQWLENIQDWCISRQLWWGHQIPAWYGENGEIFVAKTEEEARAEAAAKGYTGALKRDDDVLDTWFSSALVPFSSLGWPNETPELKHFLPSSVLVTGFDIIFFWVARMVMMTTHFTGKVPVRHGLRPRSRARRRRPEDVEEQGQYARSDRYRRRHRPRNARRQAHHRPDEPEAGREDREKDPQGIPGRHSAVRHRRAALHDGVAWQRSVATSILIWQGARAIVISATSCGMPPASC